MTKQPRPKKCRHCKEEYVPVRPMQVACGPVCAIALVNAKKAKERKALELVERREIKVRKEALKTRADYAKEAQVAINRYVRLRDAHLGCISCGKPATWPGQWHCSHFRSVGAAPQLRFNLWNMHRSCSVCNNHLSGNIGSYRPALIEKIGQAKVDWLESQNQSGRYDIPYLLRLKAVFTKKARLIEKRREGRSSWIAV